MVKLSINLPNGFLDDEPKTLIVPRRRKEVWAVTLDLLMQLDGVCRKHGIRYFCDGGTALGAVRHGGFIPWDDDLDVVMSRAEYEKLNAIAPDEFRSPYFWQTEKTDPGSARGHAQLRNSATTAILKSEMRDGRALYHFNQGIFIDIFPFDNIPDDYEERESFKTELLGIKAQIQRIRVLRLQRQKVYLTPRGIYRFLYASLAALKENFEGGNALSKAVEKLNQVAQRYNGVKTREMAPISFLPNHKEILPAYFFDEAREVDFEFMKIPVMVHCEDALAINYGNWREQVIGASQHGGLLFDTDRPYTEFLSR